MKVVVIGGTGLIGSKLIDKLKSKGIEAIAASPSTGVNTMTNEGVADVMKGATVVVDVSNSPSFEDKAVLNFFQTSTGNILKAASKAGVSHYIALSVVGADRLAESGYLRAKLAQENLIKASQIPYTIVRATQFFEFLKSISQEGTQGQIVQVPKAFLQPIAAEDVADALFHVVQGKPHDGFITIAGPERLQFSEMIEKYLKATNDPRKVVASDDARYFGTKLNDESLVPHSNAHLGSINFDSWFNGNK